MVDDELRKPLDAALVTRVLADQPAAGGAVAHHFPNVDLSEANPVLFEQVDAALAHMGANEREALGAELADFSPEAADVDVAQAVRDLAPADFEIDFLTPADWVAKRQGLLGACTEEARTLFFFDQDLDEAGTHGFTRGTQIIASLANEDQAAFGTRWFCGILSHTLDRGAEVPTWRQLSNSEGLSLELFMPISKQNLRDGNAFYSAVYRTVINIYTEKMKSVAREAFEKAVTDSLEKFTAIDPIDFEHMIVKSSEDEGVSELETLLRLYSIVQRDHVKSELLQTERLAAFLGAARTVKKIVDVGRALPEESGKRLAQMRFDELYEAGQLINRFRDPLRNGDLFEVGGGSTAGLWVLIAQPCDLMVRSDGRRSHEDNFKVAVLAPVCRGALGELPRVKQGLGFTLEHFDHKGQQSAFVSFADATPVDLNVLDLAVLRSDGACEMDAIATEHIGGFASIAWDERAARLKKAFKKTATRVEEVRKTKGDGDAADVAKYLLPPLAPAAKLRRHGSYATGKFAYKVRRYGRVREPSATSLLAAFGRYLARDANEHDFSAVRSR